MKISTVLSILVACTLLTASSLIITTKGCNAAEHTLKVNSYAYVLQAEKLAKTRTGAVEMLAGSDRDLIIIDAFYNGDEDGRWKKEELDTIRNGKAGRKILCYFSIGEAEIYREYWQAEWNTKKPEFILSENPDWPGNFKVKYWSAQWKTVLDSYLAKIIAAGFDGVMLDIVDGFEFFEQAKDGSFIDDRKNEETGNSYRQDMRKLVISIADSGRKNNAGFMVFPQNGSQLLNDPEYNKAVSGQALESVFTLEKKKQPPEHVKFILANLQPLFKAGKPLLATEYPDKDNLKEYAFNRARHYGLTLLLTERKLDILGSTGKEFKTE